MAALKLRDMLEKRWEAEYTDIPLRVLGPARYVISKVNGRFRWRLILKCRNSPRLRELMELTLKEAGADKAFGRVTFFADMKGDP